MYKAIVQDKTFDITESKEGHVVNGEPVVLDIVSISENYFHVIYKNKSYRAEVVKADVATRSFVFKINGREYPVQVKNKFDLLLEQMGMQNVGAAKLNVIKAPMPGLIIDLKVTEGQEVKQNDPLLILEAMKMENIIKSPGDGVVKSVKVVKGASVEKNQILIEF
jgi:biotin carboxyl carrier protein